MVDISRKTYERVGIETMMNEILWLNLEEGLDYKYLQEITTKYQLNHRKHRCKLWQSRKIGNHSNYGLNIST